MPDSYTIKYCLKTIMGAVLTAAAIFALRRDRTLVGFSDACALSGIIFLILALFRLARRLRFYDLVIYGFQKFKKIWKNENFLDTPSDSYAAFVESRQYEKNYGETFLTKADRDYITRNLAMIFQDPISSLNPRMTVEEIIAEGLKTRGLRDKGQLRQEVAGILNKVGLLPEHGTRYPHEFSGGQRQRIGIARALVVKPSFIIADEPVSALDVSIQAQVINLLMDIKQEMDLTILFIAHNLAVVKYFSDRIGVMYFGNMVELADADELYAHPVHPYTKSLLSAIPQPDPVSERDKQRIYYDPSVHRYDAEKPSFREIRPGHFVYASDSEMEQYEKEL